MCSRQHSAVALRTTAVTIVRQNVPLAARPAVSARLNRADAQDVPPPVARDAEAVVPVPARVARGRVQKPALEVVAIIARAPVQALAAELAADAPVLALAHVPPPAQAVVATIARAVVATLALADAKTLPKPLALHVATAAQALVIPPLPPAVFPVPTPVPVDVAPAAHLPAPEPLKAVITVVRLAPLHAIRTVQDVGKCVVPDVTYHARQPASEIVMEREN